MIFKFIPISITNKPKCDIIYLIIKYLVENIVASV